MKIIIKNSSLIFKKARQLYTGIFNVSSTRANTIVRDGFSSTNNFITTYAGNSTIMSRQIEEVYNELGLTYNTVYKRVDQLYNENYYENPFIVVEKLNISQKLTFGYWIKLENVNNNIPTLIPKNNNGAWIIDLSIIFNKETNLVTKNGLINDIHCTITAKMTNMDISGEKWSFVQTQFEFDEVPTKTFDLLISKAKPITDNIFAENPVYVANLTLINDIVDLDPMTYYPAPGHNPQKDQNL